MDERQIQQVRNFNRAVTRRVGALGDDYLGRGRPLAESRLLFEIGRDGADVRALRARLSMDSGYLSRLLRALESQGLAKSRASAEDARVRRVTLTAKGRREVDALDRRSQEFAASLLASLREPQRAQLVKAMEDVERLMRAASVVVEVADPASDDARTCIDAYLSEIDARFATGFDPTRGPSADPDELVPPAGVFLLARVDEEAIGCGALKVIEDGIGEIKRMWVSPAARGLGIAQRLLDALEQQAIAMRLHTLRLDTNRTLAEARALYARNGYREIERYNDNPYADHWFEKRVG
ncbi:helix-turn-helix domain-containing GNAT family N-acetyltransferase [Lysobacter sp. Root494]|uniref:bifunctional helix-turn-helix transcriptional regulator/GNAT family N-acetyltransferase n=1 Tax=Lysobacter sp. Root494 TaxID=1736549 RepID=UPI0006FB2131|nr:helix-turn-helix domain-containing GNAT family N-acetyltransferase [Lysobacter sp. Root494]KQY52230.1 MarR family transcriptional regulator [Lysobacter sp. Root494]